MGLEKTRAFKAAAQRPVPLVVSQQTTRKGWELKKWSSWLQIKYKFTEHIRSEKP